MEAYTHYFNTLSIELLRNDMRLFGRQIKYAVYKQATHDLTVCVLHYLIEYITTSGYYGVVDHEVRALLLEDIKNRKQLYLSPHKRNLIKRIRKYKGKHYTEMPMITDQKVQVFQRIYFDNIACNKIPASYSFTVQECRAHFRTFVPILATALQYVINELSQRHKPIIRRVYMEYLLQPARKCA